MPKATAFTLHSRHRAGFTLVEMLVIIGILGILGAIGISAYTKMQANQRLSLAVERVMSTLQHARSLAISNNAIYHIRMQNWDFSTDKPTERTLSIHCYPKINDAIKLTKEPDNFSNDAWSSYPPDVSSGVMLINSNAKNPLNNNLPYNNYRLTYEIYDNLIYFGIQAAYDTLAMPGNVLSFYPDGAASETMTFFVTDKSTYGNVSGMDYVVLNNKRHEEFDPQKNSHLQMIQVYKGGMIKLLKEKF